MNDISDGQPKGYCIVSCGMLAPEVGHLVDTGYLTPAHIYWTPPGLHALPQKLETNLVRRLAQARTGCPQARTVVAYGAKCHVSADRPLERVDHILRRADPRAIRLEGAYGYDMLADGDERQRLSGGREDKTLWFTLGWLRHWKLVYQRYFGWDEADANANFPGYYDRIIVLDALGAGDAYMEEHPEEVLELFDWTGLPIEFQPITLERFRGLWAAALAAASG